MTRDDIIRMAREAGLATDDRGRPNGYAEYCIRLTHFAALVAAAEREACAQLVEKNADVCGPNTMFCDVLRGNARKIPHPQGETPGVMLRAADEIERLQKVIASPHTMTRDDNIQQGNLPKYE